MLIIFTACISAANAQTKGNGNSAGNRKTQTARQGIKRQQRGSGQYHGSRDTTPGSPMGTGGAGGDMSGSPAGSAIETDDQTSKAQVQQDSSKSTVDSAAEQSTIRKTKNVHHRTRRHPKRALR